MRILIITNAPFLQAGNQSIRRTVEGLAARGLQIEIWLLGVEPPQEAPQGVIIKTFTTPAFLKQIFKSILHRKNTRPTPVFECVARSVNQVLDYRNDEIPQWFAGLPATLYFSLRLLLYGLLNYRSLRNVGAVWGYERGGVLPAVLLSRLARAALITSFQGTVLNFYLSRYGLWQTFVKLPLDLIATWIKADLVIMTDDGTRGFDVLLRLGHKSEKVLFVPNGVDMNELNAVQQKSKHSLGLGETDLLFVVSTRLVPHKRVDRALVLARALQSAEIENFKLFVIGGGPDEDYLRFTAEMLGITEKIVFCGPLSYKESLSILAAADMVWSFQEGSNLTNTVQDALALGKHVLVLEDGSLTGFLSVSPAIDTDLVLTVPLDHFVEVGVERIRSWIQKYRPVGKKDMQVSAGVWTWKVRVNAIEARILSLLGQVRR